MRFPWSPPPIWRNCWSAPTSPATAGGAVTAALDLAKATGSKVYLLQVMTLVPLYELQTPDLLPPPTINLEMQAAQEAAVKSRLEAWQAEAARLE